MSATPDEVIDAGPWRARAEIGDATLYLGDCLDIMPYLGRVTAVITDPPFEAEAHTPQRRVKRSANGADVMAEEPLDFDPITEHHRAEFSRLAASQCDGWVIVFCQAEAVAAWRDSLVTAGATYKRACVWIKPDGMPQYSGDRPGMGYESLVAAWAGKGKSRWNGGGRHGVWTMPKGEPVRHGHPTQKPVRLMQELVGLFTSDGTVLDPFMGSGTTGVACANLGRKFIGIEMNERYYDIACERIAAAHSQKRMPW